MITETTSRAVEALARIRDEITELNERRRHLMVTTQAELNAHGIESVIVHRFRDLDVGHRAVLFDEWRPRCDGSVLHRTSVGKAGDTRRGPYVSSNDGVWGPIGPFELLVVDVDCELWARVEDPLEESGHRQAVCRLRACAAKEGFRVHMVDREATLIDPFNAVAHVGDVWSAMLWLQGIDTSEVAL